MNTWRGPQTQIFGTMMMTPASQITIRTIATLVREPIENQRKPSTMIITRLLNIASCIMILQVAAVGAMTDKATGISFAPKVGGLDIHGVGVRKKGPIKVRGILLLMEKSSFVHLGLTLSWIPSCRSILWECTALMPCASPCPTCLVVRTREKRLLLPFVREQKSTRPPFCLK